MEGTASDWKCVHHRSRSSSGSLNPNGDADRFVPKLLDNSPSQPSVLLDPRKPCRGIGDRTPCSMSVVRGVGDLLPDPEASGSTLSSSLSS